jgi:hypothetical protein
VHAHPGARAGRELTRSAGDGAVQPLGAYLDDLRDFQTRVLQTQNANAVLLACAGRANVLLQPYSSHRTDALDLDDDLLVLGAIVMHGSGRVHHVATG